MIPSFNYGDEEDAKKNIGQMDGYRRNRGGRTMVECEISESEPRSYKRRRLILRDFRPAHLYRIIDDPAVFAATCFRFRRQRGLAFGPLFGSLYSFIGAAGGAFLSFAVAYRLGGNLQHMPLKLDSLRTLLRKNGFFCILLLRLAPIHFDAVSYAAGVSKVKPLSFALATATGIIPGTVILNVLGSSLLTGDIIAIAAAAAIYLIFITVPLLFRKKVQALLD